MGQPKEKKKRMDEELKQGVGLNNLRKRDKINGLVGAKNGGRGGPTL